VLLETAQPDALALEIRPAPLPWTWRAVTWMLALLFGMPALAVLLSPGRWDAVSLPAAAAGLGVAGWGILLLRRARATRQPQRLRLTRAGVQGGELTLAWPEILGFAAIPPPAPADGPAPGAAAMGQRIAAERAAQEWRVTARLADGGTRVLAHGLDEAAAARIRDRLEAGRDGAG
jgi:hypothetical protein